MLDAFFSASLAGCKAAYLCGGQVGDGLIAYDEYDSHGSGVYFTDDPEVQRLLCVIGES